MDKNKKDKLQNEVIPTIMKGDKYSFDRQIQILDGRNIQTGRGTGTIIATDVDQKLGFYGVPPVVQQSAISDVAGGATVDAEARAAVNGILYTLRQLGLIDT